MKKRGDPAMPKEYVTFALGKRIAYLRNQAGMTQLELSLESGLAKSYVCELEAGKRNPSLLTLEKVCLALKVTLSDLFEGLGPVVGGYRFKSPL